MATGAVSLAFYALLAFCLVGLLSANCAAAAAAAEVSSGFPYPCGAFVGIGIPGDGMCERRRCGELCVQEFLWKYRYVKAAIGDCTADDPQTCICNILC